MRNIHIRLSRISLIIMLLLAIASAGYASGSGDEGNKNDLLECDWVIHVDQTIPVTTNGFTVNYTLVLIAQKKGGTDVLGTYEGAAYLGCKMDTSNLSNKFVTLTGGFDINLFANNLTFDLVPYSVVDYSEYGIKKGELPLSPLVEYETMALFSPEMTGTGIVNPNVESRNAHAGYNASITDTAPVPMRISVISGKVHVEVPSYNMGHHFEGLLLGDPVSASAKYAEGLARIDELKEGKPETEPDSKDSGDPLGGLGSMLGNMGNNLPVPDSFPGKILPLLPDANVYNTYVSDNKKNIRVMYGTQEEYEDVTAFYEKKVTSKYKAKPIDVDNGTMYMFSPKGYQSITLMILKDQTGSYNCTVSMDVTKK